MDLMAQSESPGARWVCPNDRQLALRAKLRTGWSIKSGSLESRSSTYPSSRSGANNQSYVLTEEERTSIIQVIQRAEALDLSEQQRVGKLVERLENMKRNVCLITATRSNDRKRCGNRCHNGARCVCSCSLCAEKFSLVLGATPSLCKDCRRYICQKCSIEATGTNSTFPDGYLASRLDNLRSTVQRIVQRSRGRSQKQFLCRICSETREMWKKSGAWFFKGMPKYVLPVRKERDWTQVGHRSSTWTVGGSSRAQETVGASHTHEQHDSSSDDDATRRLSVTRRLSNMSNVSAVISDNRQSKKPLQSPLSSDSTRFRGARPSWCSVQRSDAAALGSDRSEKNLSVRNSFGEQLGRGIIKLSPSASSATLRSKSNRRSSGSPQNSRVSFEDQIIVDSKLEKSQTDKFDNDSTDGKTGGDVDHEAADADSEDNGDEERKEKTQFQELKQGSQVQALSAMTITVTDYGTLEVSLRYDPSSQCLQCKVERARNLKPMDIHGLADPFCKLNILPSGKFSSTSRLKTKTVHKTRNPEFNETINFYGTTENDLSIRALHILVLQDDPGGQDFLGEARILLNSLQPCQTKHYNVSLQDRFPVDCEEDVWGDFTSGRGRIQITLCYCTRRRALLITIHRAINLLPMDSNGFSDPFVKIYLMEDPLENSKRRRNRNKQNSFGLSRSSGRKNTSRNIFSTSVKWKTLNPEWNEEFAFSTRLTDLTNLTLSLSVWDKDFGKSNDYLGGLTLSCNSKGARLRHWIDAIKFPDHRHQGWHNLTEQANPVEQ
ncbi:rabphilin-3A isoform X2 [Prorops nasuta]|uniref:rabphilin-3A isoform X2 n=1 Tax=Prorops nasuta TaxID=863751 RepID=UPI0034CF0916